MVPRLTFGVRVCIVVYLEFSLAKYAIGCILVELLTNNYLFAGVNEMDQLDLIFQVFGTPTEAIWPGNLLRCHYRFVSRF